MVTHWVCNVAIGQNFMSAVEAVGISGVYAFFGVVSLIGAAYIAANVPETKVGGPLFWGGGRRAWVLGWAHTPLGMLSCPSSPPVLGGPNLPATQQALRASLTLCPCTPAWPQGKSFDQIQKELQG